MHVTGLSAREREREREKFLIPSVFPQISGDQAHTELKWQLLYYSGRGDKGIGHGGRGKFIGKKRPWADKTTKIITKINIYS